MRRFAAFLPIFLLVVLASCILIPASLFRAESAEALASPSSLPDPSTVTALSGPPIQFSETASYVRLNFTMFIVEFYKGSSGYNEIYNKTGGVLVYNDQIVLEYLSKAPDTWKQRGTPTGIDYIKVSDYYYKVTRHYTDYLGTTYDITYIVKSDSPMKTIISLMSGQTDILRVHWSPSGITQATYSRVQNRIVFGDQLVLHGWIGFDWDDVYQSLGDITSTATTDVANGKKADIYFSIGSVNSGRSVTVDPSTIGTSSSSNAPYRSFQRKSFYANGLFWVFYSDGTNMVYRTSSDGSTWSSASTVRASGDGTQFSTYFDGTYVSYAMLPTYSGSDTIYYRRGATNSDGTITWSASEQTVGTSSYTTAVSIGVDSSGYPYIAYRAQSPRYCFVTKSSTNNGVWTTASGYPLQLTTVAGYWAPIVVPLTSNKMYVIYNFGSGVYGKLYSGSSWGTEETVTTESTSDVWPISATSQGDDIHFVYLKDATYDIKYLKRTYGTSSWGGSATIQSSTAPYTWPVLSIDASNNLYCFWAGSPTANHIYYKRCVSGTWDSDPADWITETALTGNDRLTGFSRSWNGKIGIVYMTSTASPYDVRFAYLSPAQNHAPTIKTVTISNMDDTDKLYPYLRAYNFLATFNDTDGKADLRFGKIGFSDGATWCNTSINLLHNTASILSGTGKFTVGTVTNTTTPTGGTWTIPITLDWSIAAKTNIDVYAWVNDTANANATWYKMQSSYFNIVNTVNVANFVLSPTRGNVGGTVTATGSLTYTVSSLKVPDAEVSSVKIINPSDNVMATGSPSSGSFSIPFTASPAVNSTAYNAYVTMVHASGSYEDANIASYIADRIKVSALTSDDARLNVGSSVTLTVNLVYEYDGTAITTFSGTLNGLTLSGGIGGVYTAADVSSSPQQKTYNSVSGSESTYGLDVINMGGQDQELIVNGGFETGDWTGWTPAGMTSISGSQHRSGSYSASTGYSSYIYQTLGTAVAEADIGSFTCWLKSVHFQGANPYNFYIEIGYSDSSFTQIGLQPYGDLPALVDGVWTYIDLKPFATAGKSVSSVTFGNYMDNWNYVYVDDVSLIMRGQGSISTSVIWDRIRIDMLGAVNGRINVGAQGTLYATASLEFDGHALGSGDSLSLGGYTFTWVAANNRFEATDTKSTVQAVMVNTFTSGNEATYGITVGSMNSYSTTIIWDRVQATISVANARINIGKNASITVTGFYQYDSAAFQGSFALNNTQYQYPSAGKRGYRVQSIADGLYGLNAFTTNEVYVIWDALKVNAYSVGVGNTTVYTHMEYAYDNSPTVNGTAGFAGLQATANSTGWATFSLASSPDFSWSQTAYGIQDALYGITATAQNQTIPVTKKTYLVQSDDPISSITFSGYKLTISFSGPTGSYTLEVSGPKPTYVQGATYDLSVDYTNYLTLSHDGSNTIVVSYQLWGDFNVQSVSTDYLASASWKGEKLTVILNGTLGDTATLRIFCGSRGMPNNVVNATSVVYNVASKILTVTIQFTVSGSEQASSSLDWTLSATGPGGGGGPSPVQFTVSTLRLSVPQGQTVNGLLTFNWTGVNDLTITDVKFQNAPGWVVVAESLPKTVTKQMSDMSGTGSIVVRITAPSDAQPGDYSVVAEVDATGPGGNVASNGYVNFTVVQPPSSLPSPVSDIMAFLFVLILGIFVAYVYLFRR